MTEIAQKVVDFAIENKIDFRVSFIGENSYSVTLYNQADDSKEVTITDAFSGGRFDWDEEFGDPKIPPMSGSGGGFAELRNVLSCILKWVDDPKASFARIMGVTITMEKLWDIVNHQKVSIQTYDTGVITIKDSDGGSRHYLLEEASDEHN